MVDLEKNKVGEYVIVLDTMTHSLEPYYFWLVDFMTKIGYKVNKIGEELGASVTSAFFGEMMARKTQLERRGMEILGTINTVVKSIINLLYDLKRLDERLKIYDMLHSKDPNQRKNALLTLKRIWMDEVDIKKGRGSINSLSTTGGLEFVTLRDAFMSIEKPEQVDKANLNDRVKRILKDRLTEFYAWLKESEKELRQRRKIELEYLGAQVENLRLYTVWAEPYLKAAQMIQFKDIDKVSDAQLVHAFDQNVIRIKIRGEKEYYKKEVLETFEGAPKKISIPGLSKESYLGPKVYGVIEIELLYRTRPALISAGKTGVYRQMGNLTITFKGYVLSPKELEAIKEEQRAKALEWIEGLTKESLKALREDIMKYLAELKGEKKAEELLKFVPKSEEEKKEEIKESREVEWVKQLVKPKVMEDLYTVYDIFKKEFGFESMPDFPWKHGKKE